MLVQTLETAKNTLLNTQIQIQIANHNVSRADDKNYHRQEVVLETRPPLRYGGLYIGIGARIQQIRQSIDFLLEKRFLASVSQEEDYKTRGGYLEALGTYTFDDGETGLSVALQNFWNAWDTFNENPGESERTGVIEAAESLAAKVSEVHRDLRNLQDDIDTEMGMSVNRVNELLDLIAYYNGQIARAEPPDTGIMANDLRDKRYAAIRELSEYLPVSIEETSNGMINITVEDNSTTIHLVDETTAGSLTHLGNGDFLYTEAGGGNVTVSPHNLKGGKIFALYETYLFTGDIIGRVENFAGNLTNEVNTAHTNAVFHYDPAAQDILTVEPGFDPDPARALDISNLQDNTIGGLGNLTFSQYLADIQYTIGKEHERVIDRQNLYETVRSELEKQQQAVSGVSIDEELVNIIKFQHVFQAAARIIRATSEMLDTVVNMV